MTQHRLTSYTNPISFVDESNKKIYFDKENSVSEATKKINYENTVVAETIELGIDSSVLENRVTLRNSTESLELEDYSLLSFFQCWRDLKKQEAILSTNKVSKWKPIFVTILKCLLVFIYLAYFTAVMLIQGSSSKKCEDNINKWCDTDGLLIVITTIIFTGMFYFQVFKPIIGNAIFRWLKRKYLDSQSFRNFLNLKDKWYPYALFVSVSLYVLAILSLGIFLYIDTKGDRIRLVSAAGLLVLILCGFLFSTAPRKIDWRTIIWGIGLQFLLALVLIRSQIGRSIVLCIGNKVTAFLNFADVGSKFVFGQILLDMNSFAIKLGCLVLFFAFCIEILYHYGAMQWVVIKFGWLLQVTVGTTPCESVNAVANIFLGPTSAPLIIRPYILDMTKSELHTILTNSFASIAAGVMAIYISFGISAAHILSASVMSAPAALASSKLLYPETEVSKTRASNIKISKGGKVNVLHAGIDGVIAAIPMVANILATLVAFLSLIAFLDAILNWICALIDIDDGICSMSNIFGYLFMPLAWIMGVPWNDCYYVGQLLVTKTILNELIGYIKLSEYSKQNYVSKRAELIATYALCGFSNIGTIGIQVGSLAAIAPERTREIVSIAFRAMVAGNVACLMTACIAGTLISEADQMLTPFQNSTV